MKFLGKFVRTLFAVALVVVLASCAATGTGEFGPYNISSNGDDSRLILNGFDPVAYHAAGKHLRGRPDIKADHDGVTYRFEIEANKVIFLQTPARYAPQFGGFCANGTVYGIPWGGDGDTLQIIAGKLFIFGGQASKKYFLMNEKANLALAKRYWSVEIKGGNAVIQRDKRLV